jgi:hypothetical protein
MAKAPRPMQLEFLRHAVATGYAPDARESVFLLLDEEPQRYAVRLDCPHACDRLVEQLREARAALWPHPAGGPDESDEYYSEQVAPGVEVTYLGGQAQGGDPLPVAEVERALARHERAARMLRKWLDAAAGTEG